MSNKPIDMYKIRQLLRLYAVGRGTKFISRSTGIARNTVKKYLHQFVTLRLTLAEMEAMSDAALARAFLLEKPKVVNNRLIDLELLLPALAARLKKRGVTKKMLYEQYIGQHPDGYIPLEQDREQTAKETLMPQHDNIRGEEYYQ